MDYRQARAFLEEAGRYGSVYGLDTIRNLMERLGNVQEELNIIHAAGTNGKGSVCAMLAQILQEAGYRTGVYASPAVFEPEEIIKVDGRNILPKDFAEVIADVRKACLKMQEEGLAHPTAFEVETAAAFCYFKRQGCDYVVLETGLGGTLDAVNLITRPLCSVITSIGRDHMAVLGETLEEIAEAKAGIIKPGCPCVTAKQDARVMAVLEKAAAKAGSELVKADDGLLEHFTYDESGSYFEIASNDHKGGRKTIRCALAGAFQRANIACVLAVVRLLAGRGVFIPFNAAAKGLENVRLPGRFERIGEKPDFYIDGAHNESAALLLKETVQNCFTNRKIVYIIGVLADKEYDKVLKRMLPCAEQVFTVAPDNPRALDAYKLAQQARRYHPAVMCVPDLRQAAGCAAAAAGADGVVLAFGSFSYLGDLKQAVKNRI